MTTTQIDPIALGAAIASALTGNATPATPVVDPKYHVTSEFTERPYADVKPLIAAYHAAEKKLAKAKAAVEAAEKAIKEMMNGAEVLVAEETKQYLVESRVTVGQRFDTTRFKRENPETAAKYLVDRYSRNFRVLA